MEESLDTLYSKLSLGDVDGENDEVFIDGHLIEEGKDLGDCCLVGGKLGKVLEVDSKDNCSAVGKWLRVWIVIDCSRPLKKDVWMLFGTDQKKWITVRVGEKGSGRGKNTGVDSSLRDDSDSLSSKYPKVSLSGTMVVDSAVYDVAKGFSQRTSVGGGGQKEILRVEECEAEVSNSGGRGLGVDVSYQGKGLMSEKGDKVVHKMYKTVHVDSGLNNVDVHMNMTQVEDRSRGLALLWINEVDVEIKFFLRIILILWCMMMMDILLGEVLASQLALPWLCFGDFNELLSAFDKLGGAGRFKRQMQQFRDAVKDCRLLVSWAGQCHSDPCPLLVKVLKVKPSAVRSVKPFRFEDCWVRYPQCKTAVMHEWQDVKLGI
ncbi:hypothetical protein PTKIN_Ptkin05aG0137900 [Pterospermum kingtungense]